MKKRRKKILIGTGVGVFALTLLLLLLYLFLPKILESYIIPKFAIEAGIKNISVSIDRADIHGLELSALTISENKQRGIAVDKCKIDLDGTALKQITIDGFTLFAELKDKIISIPGITLPKSNTASSSNSANFAIPTFLSQDFSLTVTNSELNISINKGGKLSSVKIPFSFSLQRSGDQINYTIKTTNVVINYDNIALSVPEFSLLGSIIINGEDLQLSGIAKFANIAIKREKIRIENASGNIPFAFKLTKNGIEFTLPEKKELIGSCTIAKVAKDDQVFNDLSFETVQSTEKFSLIGSYSRIIEGRPIKFAVHVTPPSNKDSIFVEALTDFNEKGLNIDFSTLPQLKSNAIFTGDIDLHAEVKYKNSQLIASSRVKISNGNIEDKEKKLSIEGVEFDFELEDLLKLKSKPSQKLTFKKCTMQDFVIENGDFSFQSESLDSFLIEKSQFGWCSGTVAVNAFRVIPSHPEEIDIILYCDRLKVAEFLNQFKIGNASGDGRVSGKIPVVYNKKKLNIDDGFLYSTPGLDGNIALTDFMGPLSQMGGVLQLEIAEAALEDFNYKWLRIKLNSEKRELLLQLEMDGAPAGLLPFGFDPLQGGLYKSNDPGTTANFIGISFQINFRLPANRVLEYGSGFQKLQEKFK